MDIMIIEMENIKQNKNLYIIFTPPKSAYMYIYLFLFCLSIGFILSRFWGKFVPPPIWRLTLCAYIVKMSKFEPSSIKSNWKGGLVVVVLVVLVGGGLFV